MSAEKYNSGSDTENDEKINVNEDEFKQIRDFVEKINDLHKSIESLSKLEKQFFTKEATIKRSEDKMLKAFERIKNLLNSKLNKADEAYEEYINLLKEKNISSFMKSVIDTETNKHNKIKDRIKKRSLDKRKPGVQTDPQEVEGDDINYSSFDDYLQSQNTNSDSTDKNPENISACPGVLRRKISNRASTSSTATENSNSLDIKKIGSLSNSKELDNNSGLKSWTSKQQEKPQRTPG